MNVAVYMADADGKAIGTCEYGTWMKFSASDDNSVTVVATGKSHDATAHVFTRGAYVATYRDGSAVAGQFMAKYNPAAQNPSTTLTNNAPADLNNTGDIKICTVRNQGDCDYCYLITTPGACKYTVTLPKNMGASYITFPISEAIEFGDSRTVTYEANNYAPMAAQASVIMTNKAQGGCDFVYDTSTFFSQSAKVLANQTPQGFSWAVSPANFGNAPACFTPSGTNVAFSFAMTFDTSEGPFSAHIGTESGGQYDVSLPIPPVSVFFGCLADGTTVLLGNGEITDIQDVPIGATLRSFDHNGNPAIVQVSDIIFGAPETIYRVELANGLSVGMTESHGLTTAEGQVRAASQLVIGETLFSAKGLSRIVSITQEHNDTAPVWNLKLNADVDQDATELVFLADGVLVGGSALQKVAVQKLRIFPVRPFAHLPEALHQEYRIWAIEQADQ